MRIAVVGATGLVGREMLTVLAERGFGNEEVIAAASPKSVGKKIAFAGRELTVMSVDDAIAARPQYAIFSAGAAASREYAPHFVETGTTVIDNSSAWRKDPTIPLIVPEINLIGVDSGQLVVGSTRGQMLSTTHYPPPTIISNPNCSTIQMVLAISALQREYGIRRRTHESGGAPAIDQCVSVFSDPLPQLRDLLPIYGVVPVAGGQVDCDVHACSFLY